MGYPARVVSQHGWQNVGLRSLNIMHEAKIDVN